LGRPIKGPHRFEETVHAGSPEPRLAPNADLALHRSPLTELQDARRRPLWPEDARLNAAHLSEGVNKFAENGADFEDEFDLFRAIFGAPTVSMVAEDVRSLQYISLCFRSAL